MICNSLLTSPLGPAITAISTSSCFFAMFEAVKALSISDDNKTLKKIGIIKITLKIVTISSESQKYYEKYMKRSNRNHLGGYFNFSHFTFFPIGTSIVPHNMATHLLAHFDHSVPLEFSVFCC